MVGKLDFECKPVCIKNMYSGIAPSLSRPWLKGENPSVLLLYLVFCFAIIGNPLLDFRFFAFVGCPSAVMASRRG